MELQIALYGVTIRFDKVTSRFEKLQVAFILLRLTLKNYWSLSCRTSHFDEIADQFHKVKTRFHKVKTRFY